MCANAVSRRVNFPLGKTHSYGLSSRLTDRERSRVISPSHLHGVFSVSSCLAIRSPRLVYCFLSRRMRQCASDFRLPRSFKCYLSLVTCFAIRVTDASGAPASFRLRVRKRCAGSLGRRAKWRIWSCGFPPAEGTDRSRYSAIPDDRGMHTIARDRAVNRPEIITTGKNTIYWRNESEYEQLAWSMPLSPCRRDLLWSCYSISR